MASETVSDNKEDPRNRTKVRARVVNKQINGRETAEVGIREIKARIQ